MCPTIAFCRDVAQVSQPSPSSCHGCGHRSYPMEVRDTSETSCQVQPRAEVGAVRREACWTAQSLLQHPSAPSPFPTTAREAWEHRFLFSGDAVDQSTAFNLKDQFIIILSVPPRSLWSHCTVICCQQHPSGPEARRWSLSKAHSNVAVLRRKRWSAHPVHHGKGPYVFV